MVRHSDSNHKAFSAFTMDEDLCQLITLQVAVFHFLSSHVLTLLKFENILLAVNNSEGNFVGVKLGDVSSLHPPILGYGFICLFF